LEFVPVVHGGACGFNALAFATGKTKSAIFAELTSLKDSSTVGKGVVDWAKRLHKSRNAAKKKTIPESLWVNSKVCTYFGTFSCLCVDISM
jgi:hypothetical protein